MKSSKSFWWWRNKRLLAFCCLLLPLLCHAEQFVDITAEITVDGWDWWLFSDELNVHPGLDRTPSIFHTNQVYHCVVGTNSWLIETERKDVKVSYWFTGTNVVEQTLTSNLAPYITVSASFDGNPGRPVHVSDRMVFNSTARIFWLAFCSSSTLKHDGRKIFPPGDEWKETRLAFSDWSDKTTVFKDNLGLPKSLTLLTTNGQPVVQYKAHLTTNVLGWNFPSEFYLVQYIPRGSNEWQVYLTAKGRIITISAGTKPQPPAEAMKNSRRIED